MSKQLNSIDPERLIVYYSPTVLSIIAGGHHRRFFVEDSGRELLNEIYNLAKAFKEDPTEENEQGLLRYLDPEFRTEIGDDGLLLQDVHGNYYLHDMPHIPIEGAIKDMLDEYREHGMDTTPIVNLWKLALDNPSDTARAGLMKYINDFGVPVTDSGYMIMYKSVRNKNDVIEKLAYVVGQEYFDKMRRRDQNPRDWWVYELPQDAIYREESPRFFIRDTEEVVYEREYTEEEYQEVYEDSPYEEDQRGTYTKEIPLEPMGNLAELFRELVLNKQDLEASDEEKEPIFEPYHRGDYGMTIKLGEPTTMPREKCDPNINVSCSHGLHVGSYEYVSTFHPRDGSVLACLVNPRDIVALPDTDHSKIRTCAYLPYGIMKTDEDGNWEEAEASYWEEDFIDYEKEQLEKRIQQLTEHLERDEEPSSRIQDLVKSAKDRLVRLKG